VLKPRRREFPGFAIVNENKHLRPWDTHYQFSINTLLSNLPWNKQGLLEQARAETLLANQWLLQPKECPGVAIANFNPRVLGILTHARIVWKLAAIPDNTKQADQERLVKIVWWFPAATRTAIVSSWKAC